MRRGTDARRKRWKSMKSHTGTPTGRFTDELHSLGVRVGAVFEGESVDRADEMTNPRQRIVHRRESHHGELLGVHVLSEFKPHGSVERKRDLVYRGHKANGRDAIRRAADQLNGLGIPACNMEKKIIFKDNSICKRETKQNGTNPRFKNA